MIPSSFLFPFQSTLPCGSDLGVFTSIVSSSSYFNPRSLAGATICRKVNITGQSISIHAPLRERRCRRASGETTPKFQSTLPCGSDIAAIESSLKAVNFNPRSLAGATIGRIILLTTHGLFQSTLPCGSDMLILRSVFCAAAFQSTLPCGSDFH